MTKLRTGTFNILTQSEVPPFEWSRRRDDVVAILNKYDCGIVGLQEVKIGQLQYISEHCGYEVLGEPRQDPRETDGGEYSCIMFKSNIFKVLDSGTFWLSETPEVPGSKSWDTNLARVCTWAHFISMADKSELHFFNTHLDHRGDVARHKGLELVLERMRPALESGKPCVLTGDFNVRPEDSALRVLDGVLGNTRQLSLSKPTGPFETFHCFKDRREVDPARFAHIDYVFVSPGIKVNFYRVADDYIDGRLPSDHYPVIVDLEY